MFLSVFENATVVKENQAYYTPASNRSALED